MQVIYEDNHLLIVNKEPGEIVQGDKTGDKPLVEELKDWIKKKYNKPGNVFLGVVHRLDRPVGGLVIFAKTSKALTRLNQMLRDGSIHKTYRALSRYLPERAEGELIHHIKTVERNNKSYAFSEPRSNSKEARLRYKVIAKGTHYNLFEIELLTGRKHQIRVQMSAIGCPIKGDLKYGDKRSNEDGSISLIAKSLDFIHPVTKEKMHFEIPSPDEKPWNELWQ